MTAGVREPSEWSSGPSDIEGKTTRVGASQCGQRTSFNRTRVAGHLDEIQGAAANTLNLFRNGTVGFHRLVRLFAQYPSNIGVIMRPISLCRVIQYFG